MVRALKEHRICWGYHRSLLSHSYFYNLQTIFHVARWLDTSALFFRSRQHERTKQMFSQEIGYVSDRWKKRIFEKSPMCMADHGASFRAFRQMGRINRINEVIGMKAGSVGQAAAGGCGQVAFSQTCGLGKTSLEGVRVQGGRRTAGTEARAVCLSKMAVGQNQW